MQREQRNELRKKIQNYSYGLNDYLNFGKRSNIFKAINEITSEIVAIKVVDLRSKDLPEHQSIKEQLSVEIDALKKLSHPNIIRCLDIYSTVNNCYIVTQFCDGGDLANRIAMRGALRQNQALQLFRDLIMAYAAVAHQRYIHGGLKPSSILLKDNVLKLSGFGNCRKMNKPEIKKEVPFNLYQSPQSIADYTFNQKSDVWSLGMLLYVMLHGRQPWEYTSPKQLLDVCYKQFPISNDLSEQIKQFLKQTITPKPQARLSFEEIMAHRFTKKLIANHFSSEKYQQGIGPQILSENKGKKDNHMHQVSKVEKHLTCQINWMRFLFRLMDKFISSEEYPSSTLLKFIVLRQLSVQFCNLRLHLQQGENPFNFSHWQQFLQEKDKVAKYLQIFRKNQPRYEKAKVAYLKLLQKYYINKGGQRGFSQILNDNFILSEYNCIFALGAAAAEIKRLWEKISKEYPPRQKYGPQTVFRFKGELLLLDFVTTYYQLNSLMVQDFQRVEYFQKMSKLDIILEYQPVELDATALSEFEAKLKQLSII